MPKPESQLMARFIFSSWYTLLYVGHFTNVSYLHDLDENLDSQIFNGKSKGIQWLFKMAFVDEFGRELKGIQVVAYVGEIQWC